MDPFRSNVMTEKRRLVIVGGKHFNIPRQLKEHFDIVRHYEQDERVIRGNVPSSDLILVIRNWVSHPQVQAVRLRQPDTQAIWVNKGWNAMREELERRGIIEKVVAPAVVEEDPEESITPEDTQPDPLESMTMEELDKLTAPTEVTPPIAHDDGGRAKTDPTYVPRKYTKRVKPKEPAMTPEQSVIGSEVTGMILSCQRKVDEKNALLKERELLDVKISAVSKEIEEMRPVLQAMEALQRAAREVRNKVGKVG